MRGLVCVLLVAAGGCVENNFAADTVDLARLTVGTATALTAALDADPVCGFFGTQAVLQVEGEAGRRGHIVRTVERCLLDFEARPFVDEDCNGDRIELGGRATVSATVRVDGRLTGDDEEPIIPAGPDATRVVLSTVLLDGLTLREGDDGSLVRFREGTLQGALKPRLAAESSNGLCAIPTPHVAFSGVTLADASLVLTDPTSEVHVSVRTSSLAGQFGTGPNGENALAGGITVFTETVDIDAPLDDAYSASRVAESFACEPDLELPARYDCDDDAGADVLAENLARGVVQGLGAIATAVLEDRRCGFGNPALAPVIEANVGSVGSATYRTLSCVIDLPAATILDTDCARRQTLASGRVVVDARRIVRGRVTGGAEPILPLTDDAVTLIIDRAELDGFTVTSSATVELLSGQLSGAVTPRLALGRDGICDFATPIAAIDDVVVTQASIALAAGGRRVVTPVDAGMLSAQLGDWRGNENTLTGELTIDGATETLAVALDPDYRADTFAASFACQLDGPPSFDCDPTGQLATSVAQATPALALVVASLVDADPSCGFSAPNVVASARPSVPAGDVGTVTFAVAAPCDIDLPVPTVVDTDCAGVRTLAQGKLRITGSRVVDGFVTGLATQPVAPTKMSGATIDFVADAEDFRVWRSDTDGSAAISGRLAGRVTPEFALDARTGACTKITPISRLEDLRYTNATVQVVAGENTFQLAVDTSALAAQTGDGNQLIGTLTSEGVTYPAPGVLDPAYDAAAFAASFACDPDLRQVSGDAACSLRQPLGQLVARRLVESVAAVTQLVSTDTACGYASPAVATQPIAVDPAMPTPGQPAIAFFAAPLPPAPGCTMGPGAGVSASIGEDCFRRHTVVGGRVTVTSTRSVRGIFDPMAFIVPVEADAIEVGVSVAVFDRFSVAQAAPGAAAMSQLMLRSGEARFIARPILGLSANNPGVFDQPTPVLSITEFAPRNLAVTVRVDGARYNLVVDGGGLTAQTGTFGAVSNRVQGSLRIDGEVVPIDGVLDPDFSQTVFDLSYDCNPALAGPVR